MTRWLQALSSMSAQFILFIFFFMFMDIICKRFNFLFSGKDKICKNTSFQNYHFDDFFV